MPPVQPLAALERRDSGPEITFAFLGDFRTNRIADLPLFSKVSLVQVIRTLGCSDTAPLTNSLGRVGPAIRPASGPGAELEVKADTRPWRPDSTMSIGGSQLRRDMSTTAEILTPWRRHRRLPRPLLAKPATGCNSPLDGSLVLPPRPGWRICPHG
jgi:hypothetical protein